MFWCSKGGSLLAAFGVTDNSNCDGLQGVNSTGHKIFVGALVLVVVGLILAAFRFSAWLQEDEPALDYSSMAIEKGRIDSESNGFTQIREFSAAYDDELRDAVTAAYLVTRADWDLSRMQAVIESHQDLLEAFEAAFQTDYFVYDQPISPDTLMPEISGMRSYAELRILEARILEREGKPDDALRAFMQLESDLEVFARSGGGLISVLTMGVITQNLNQAIEDLLAHASPSHDSLAVAARDYDIGDQLVEYAQTAYRFEFHFSCRCIEMALESPDEFLGGGAQEEGFIAEWNRRKAQASMRYFFKVNQTQNRFFQFYEEMIGELPKPASERGFPIAREMEESHEDQSLMSLLSRNMVGRLLSAILLPAVQGVTEKMDLIEVGSQAARLSLGLRAYYAQYGELPERLDELVPKYIATVPRDPFDGELMRFDRNRAILYSVGNDFMDDGGSELPFAHEITEADEPESAQNDRAEPTFPLRVAM